jgi:hypothetical protein
LPPKAVIIKRKTDGRVGLNIRRIALEVPKVSIRAFKAKLLALNFGPEEIPKPATIHKFLKVNAFEIIRARKKLFISN